ncbi:histone acetyltransferase complex subunit Eaf7 [Schizosaccharomyces osmophilus]|uniref:Histone acetyltransferase complex subunit Eaf7 n=1 Tax=Schizosaccharomyces osmophilus TaxID=2545709 RepID=A0AAE9WEL9_9SCHI|nr:histone acetyltransferase complex subunit Eaf7 [Schizosaccharomyces osmophilus]WBW74425.1 histone acetyltransferase complex subunit Eaf7 [Schizosaccharomyces osmophilus]
MGVHSSSTSPQKQQKEEEKTPSSPLPPSREWSIMEETLLLKAICQGLRPVGTKKHFHMIGMLRMIHDGCQTSTKRVQDVWEKVETLYNLQEFERLEAVPSPSAGEKRKRDAEVDDAKEESQTDFELPKFILHSTTNPPLTPKSTPIAGSTGEKKMTRSSIAAAAAAAATADKHESNQEPLEEPDVKEEKDEDSFDEPPTKQLRSSTMKPTTPSKNHDAGSTRKNQANQEKTEVTGKQQTEESSNTQAAQKQSEPTNPSPPIRRSTRSRRA